MKNIKELIIQYTNDLHNRVARPWYKSLIVNFGLGRNSYYEDILCEIRPQLASKMTHKS